MGVCVYGIQIIGNMQSKICKMSKLKLIFVIALGR